MVKILRYLQIATVTIQEQTEDKTEEGNAYFPYPEEETMEEGETNTPVPEFATQNDNNPRDPLVSPSQVWSQKGSIILSKTQLNIG